MELFIEVNNEWELPKDIVTGDETWINGHDLGIPKSSPWKYPESSKILTIWQVWLNVRVMFTMFFKFNGIGHNLFLLQGQTFNKEFYALCVHCLGQK